MSNVRDNSSPESSSSTFGDDTDKFPFPASPLPFRSKPSANTTVDAPTGPTNYASPSRDHDSSDSDAASNDLGQQIGQIVDVLKSFDYVFEEESKAQATDSGLESQSNVREEPQPDKTMDHLLFAEGRLRKMRLYLQLGDYAGRLWNCLRLAARHLRKPWPSSVVRYSSDLKLEQSVGRGPASETLQDCLDFLRKGDLEVGIEVAEVAIHAYAIRNQICHVNDPARYGACGQGPSLVERDLENLEEILPDDQVKNTRAWRCLLESWDKCQAWLETQEEAYGSTRYLEHMPIDDEERVEFRHAFNEGVFKERPTSFFRRREERIPNTPRGRTRSDPLPYVLQGVKRKASSPLPGEHPSKRRR